MGRRSKDVPSVRLILTDHGLDRMIWKGKGAFILGCTSPFKAIMIDQPGMGKVDLWIEFYFALSEKWAVGVMGRRSNGLSE
jgi:hypothetical protein